MAETRNALAGETSPYLLQHSDNPVQWYPWGEEALTKAKREGKPILLSVGYSACHWCHVMAHESFEDESTAMLMNQLFVNIKVDREERPDLDKIYQLSHQLLTRRSGGWPLTMFLTPEDLIPFFGGTYFPLTPRFGMPAFKEILTRVAEFFETHHQEIRTQNRTLVEALRDMEPQSGDLPALSAQPLNQARAELDGLYEPRDGGFGGAPKFPHPTNIERLLRHYALTARQTPRDERALEMVEHTLQKMAAGGLYDHLGGGFCRYSVDDQWMIPHFEKMLYDNGPLLCLYSDLARLRGSQPFRQIVRKTAEWVLREMQSPLGGYYSTLDADSEGEEGKYYVWTPEQVQSVLEPEEYSVFSIKYGLDRDPNFEGHAWHLHTFSSDEEITRVAGIGFDEANALIDTAKSKLFSIRETRIRPGLDNKCLTSWNALMIKAMASAGHVCEEPRFIDSGFRALDFVRSIMWQNGRLLATSKDGRAHLPAYLDDYAFLIDAILCMAQHRWRTEDIVFAVELAEVVLSQFEDKDRGGFYFTAHDHEQLIYRPKPMMDDALPSGNGIAAYALARLGHLVGEFRYLEAAERTLQLAAASMRKIPHAHNALLLALEEYLQPPQTIILRGEAPQLPAWQERALRHYCPKRLSFTIPATETSLPGLLTERKPSDSGVIAYVCEGHQCGAPITDYDEFDRVIGLGDVKT